MVSTVQKPPYRPLPIPDNDPNQKDRKRLSEGWDSLLYETYNDYFNMEEEEVRPLLSVDLSKFNVHSFVP